MSETLDTLELLVQIRSTGLANLQAITEATKVLGANATAINATIAGLTQHLQGMSAAFKGYTGEVASAMSAMASARNQAASSAENAERRELRAIEATIKALERKATIAGKSGRALIQQQEVNLLGGFDGKATENQINRVKAAFENLSKVAGNGPAFATNIRQFIQNPLYAAGLAAEGLLTAMGPLGIGIGAVGLIAGTASLGVFKLANSLAASSLEIKNFASRIGSSTQFAQEFLGATARMGVNGEALTSSIRKLAGGLAEGGEAGKLASEGIEKLGIHARTVTGELRPMEELIPEIFKGLAAVPDFATRSVLSLNILGRSFKELAPAIKEYEENAAAVRRSGVIISPEAQKQALDYRLQVVDLTNAWGALIHKLQEKAVGVIEITGAMNFASGYVQDLSRGHGTGAIGNLSDLLGLAFGKKAAPEKPISIPVEGNTLVNDPVENAQRASNSAWASRLIAQYDPEARAKEAQDKLNDLVKQLDSIKSGGGVPTSGAGSRNSLEKQLATAKGILDAAKAVLKVTELEKVTRDLVNESVAKELYGEERITDEFQKRVTDLEQGHFSADVVARNTAGYAEVRDNELDRYNAGRTTERSRQSRTEQLAIAAGRFDLEKLRGQRESSLDIASGRLTPDSPVGIIAANRDRQAAITREFRASLQPLGDIASTVVGQKDPAEQDKIRHEVRLGFIEAEKRANAARYASETQMLDELAALDKRRHDEFIAAERQIAAIQSEARKAQLSRDSQRIGIVQSLQDVINPGNPVRAAQFALQQRLSNANDNAGESRLHIEEQLAAKEITSDQARVLSARMLNDLANERGEAELRYEEQIGELQKRRIEQYQTQAHELAGALLTRGGFAPFIREQVKGVGQQILGNAITPIVKSASETLANSVSGQRDSNGNPTGLGKLLQGTFLAPHDEQKITLTANTVSHNKNTDALVKLTAEIGKMKAVMDGTASDGTPVSSGSTLDAGGIPGLPPGVADAISLAGTGLSSTGIKGLNKIISTGIGGLASFGGLMANPLGGLMAPDSTKMDPDVAYGPGQAGGPVPTKGVGALGYAAAGVDVALGTFAAISDFKKGGARGALAGTGDVLATAAAVDPEPVSKAALAIGATIMKVGAALFGDPKAARSRQIDQELAAAKYTAPAPVNLTIDSSGRAIDTNYKGQIRVLNAMPGVTMRSVATGFGPETNTTGFGALLGLKPQPGDLLTTQQRRLGLTELPALTSTPQPKNVTQTPSETHIHLHIDALDARSVLDHSHVIAESVRLALNAGHPLGAKIQSVARPV